MFKMLLIILLIPFILATLVYCGLIIAMVLAFVLAGINKRKKGKADNV